MVYDRSNPCCQWLEKNTLNMEHNTFCILSYSFEDTDRCLLTGSTGQGPFYLPHPIVRKDIREYQPGADLWFCLKVVDVKGCRPIPGLAVDIWHSNAYGVYSGFSGYDHIHMARGRSAVPTDQERFLRGRQFTDGDGMVEFLTIMPGWYAPRTRHIHIKVLDRSREILTTQLFFPQELNDELQSLPPYNSRPPLPYTNANDLVLVASHGVQGGWPKFTRLGESCFRGTLTIGVDYRPLRQ